MDQEAPQNTEPFRAHIPHGAGDQTGNRPLVERARRLRPVARCAVPGTGGFTHPTNEFAISVRVHNRHACNSRWSECAGLITADHVPRMLDRMGPDLHTGAGEHVAAP